jgi:uncharacterized protein
MLRDARVKFTRESPATLTVQSVDADGVRINGRIWAQTIAVTTQVVLSDWQQESVSDLKADDFSQLLTHAPELIILGTGGSGLFPPRELVFSFARAGVGLEVMTTAAAARTFNVLAGEGRNIAAVFYQ